LPLLKRGQDFIRASGFFINSVELRRNQAEPQIPVAVVGRVPVAVSGAAFPGVVDPAAPAHNARRTSG